MVSFIYMVKKDHVRILYNQDHEFIGAFDSLAEMEAFLKNYQNAYNQLEIIMETDCYVHQ